MSILSNDNGSVVIFNEFKKQASMFFRDKIKAARLALTDVTSVQLLVEEATNGNPETPDSRTLKIISRAAFEVDDYWRIVAILHQRLVRFDVRNWRALYNTLIILEHLLTHGPERIAEEFEIDKDTILQIGSFQFVDEKGFNWGFNMRKKSDFTLKLLENGAFLKEERDRARKISSEIHGFGSLSLKMPNLKQEGFNRCHSEITDAEAGKENFRLGAFDKEMKPLLSLKKMEYRSVDLHRDDDDDVTASILNRDSNRQES